MYIGIEHRTYGGHTGSFGMKYTLWSRGTVCPACKGTGVPDSNENESHLWMWRKERCYFCSGLGWRLKGMLAHFEVGRGNNTSPCKVLTEIELPVNFDLKPPEEQIDIVESLAKEAGVHVTTEFEFRERDESARLQRAHLRVWEEEMRSRDPNFV